MSHWKRKSLQKARFIPRNAAQLALMQTLDNVNAMDELEAVVRRSPHSVHAFGPKDILSNVTDTPLFAAGLIWYRPVGYYEYQMLNIFGLWAIKTDHGAELRIGSLQQNYQVDHFNAESYFFHLRKGFDIHYGKITAPPEGDSVIWHADYATDQRLNLRRAIVDTLTAWTFPTDETPA